MSTFRPGRSVRWYRPSRSTTSIRCCCTTRTDLDRVTTISRTIATARISPKIWSPDNSLSPDERRCALDLDDPDHLARVDDLRCVVRPSLPQLAADLDHALPV